MTDMPPILAGKRGLITGLANKRSIAWGVARAAAAAGAELTLTCQDPGLERRAGPLAAEIGATLRICDLGDDDSLAALAGDLEARDTRLDFVLHAAAWADRSALAGRYIDTDRQQFRDSLDISAFSFAALARALEPHLTPGASLLTLTYYGAEKAVPHYNVMGVAKAALEASVRYMALDLGPAGIRVNAISAGPIKTLAAGGIPGFRAMLKWNEITAPLHRNVDQEDVGRTALWLLSDLASGVTGEIVHVDSGYHALGMIPPERMAEAAAFLGRKQQES